MLNMEERVQLAVFAIWYEGKIHSGEITTKAVAERLGITTAQARRALNKALDAGMVAYKGKINVTTYSRDYPGFAVGAAKAETWGVTGAFLREMVRRGVEALEEVRDAT